MMTIRALNDFESLRLRRELSSFAQTTRTAPPPCNKGLFFFLITHHMNRAQSIGQPAADDFFIKRIQSFTYCKTAVLFRSINLYD